MTGTELQQMLDTHCQDMKAGMPGFLFYGILSCTDGTTLSKASASDDVAKFHRGRIRFTLDYCESSEEGFRFL